MHIVYGALLKKSLNFFSKKTVIKNYTKDYYFH